VSRRHGAGTRARSSSNAAAARTDVIFDFYFDDVSAEASARNQASIDVGHQIQLEDDAICVSVQRGLRSRAYGAGRLSVRRETGEHLVHRLLHADLKPHDGYYSVRLQAPSGGPLTKDNNQPSGLDSHTLARTRERPGGLTERQPSNWIRTRSRGRESGRAA
jgi:choline monooxygenase